MDDMQAYMEGEFEVAYRKHLAKGCTPDQAKELAEKDMCVSENEGKRVIRVQVEQVRYGYIPVEVADDFMESLNATSKRSRILKARKIAADALHEAPEKVVWNEPEDIYPTGSIL